MTADEFVKIVRKGSDKLRVDDIVFNTGCEEFHGKGLIRNGASKPRLPVQCDRVNFIP
jgi:hypothetical protein